MKNQDSATFLFGLVKRARKYYLGVTTITQDVEDQGSASLNARESTNAFAFWEGTARRGGKGPKYPKAVSKKISNGNRFLIRKC